MRSSSTLALVPVLLVAAPAAKACATCGCALSSDGATGFWATAGWRLSLQYDFLNQDQLRLGTRSISPAQVAALNTPFPGAGQEVEHQTINRYLTLGLSYSPDSEWNFKLLVPYIDRSHTTYGPASNPLTPDQLSGATVAGLGDVKFITSYQGLLADHNLGIQVGVKLPTGHYGGQNADGGPVAGRAEKVLKGGQGVRVGQPGKGAFPREAFDGHPPVGGALAQPGEGPEIRRPLLPAAAGRGDRKVRPALVIDPEAAEG